MRRDEAARSGEFRYCVGAYLRVGRRDRRVRRPVIAHRRRRRRSIPDIGHPLVQLDERSRIRLESRAECDGERVDYQVWPRLRRRHRDRHRRRAVVRRVGLAGDRVHARPVVVRARRRRRGQ